MTKKKRKLTSCVTTSEKKGTQEQSPEKKEPPCALAAKEPEAETHSYLLVVNQRLKEIDVVKQDAGNNDICC